MKNSLKHNENVMLVLLLIGEALAYLYAMLLRYVILNWFYTNPTREYDFYKVFLWIVLFFYLAVFQFRKNRRVEVWKQEIADKIFDGRCHPDQEAAGQYCRPGIRRLR